VEAKPMLRKAIAPMPVVKPLRVNAPNSVFALGGVSFAK
jgi:Rrf2 family iron-sulfur cluster assembly transcriptional regulator